MGMSLDEKHGIVFVPTANADDAYVGTNRVGDNLFANTLLALNAENGERVCVGSTVMSRHRIDWVLRSLAKTRIRSAPTAGR